MKRRAFFRWGVRGLCLAAAVLFVIGGPAPVWLARLFPAASPLTAFAASVARQQWFLGLYWFIPPLLLIGLAVWKGRFFCRWICPLGTIYAVSSRFSRRRPLLRRFLNGYLFWTIIAASFVGVPLFLFLDPLSTFNRFGPLARGVVSLAWLVPVLLVPLFFALGFVQPFVWCARICPLGYCFGFLRRLRRGWPKRGEKLDRTRREILVGIFLGVPLAAAARRLGLVSETGRGAAVLPPGATDQATFSALCSRCYSCVSVCPTHVIRVSRPIGQSPGQLFQPELDTDRAACDPACNRCSQVCPTGALRPLTLPEKRQRQIGRARVWPAACLAWTGERECMDCQRACPYAAIETRFSRGGLPSPRVDRDRCRGCGACQNVCPGNERGKAIIVHGVDRQRRLPETSVVAEIDRAKCRAWADGGLCMLCRGVCEYDAIRDEPDEHGVSRPVIVAEACIGCRACELECPGNDLGKAISMKVVPARD
ncbi:MAG: 4Fe-4S dicluster domain-containing protein [Planctomycetota bacterium]